MSTAIITITFNSSNQIIKLIESLKNDLSNSNKLYIYENNSDEADHTKKLIRKWIKKNKKISNYIKFHINKKNYGFSQACNNAFINLKNKYEYIFFINPDVILKKGYSINTILKHLVKNKADIIGCKILLKNGIIQKSVFNKPNIYTMLFEFSNLKKY